MAILVLRSVGSEQIFMYANKNKRLICAQKEEKGRNVDKFVQILKTIKEP